MLTLINADKFLNPDDRLQPLLSGNNNIIEIAVEELEIGYTQLFNKIQWDGQKHFRVTVGSTPTTCILFRGNSNDSNEEQLQLTIDGKIESQKSDENAEKLVKMVSGKLSLSLSTLRHPVSA